MSFVSHLTTVYQEHPAQALSIALWKVLASLQPDRGVYSIAGETITHLEYRDEDRLLVYWDRNDRANLPVSLLEGVRFAVLHQDYLACLPPGTLPVRKPYFRLIFRGRQFNPVELPEGFALVPARPEGEAAAVAFFIGQCYRDIHPSASTVLDWTAHPVYNPDLWVWCIDRKKDRPAALGIAEHDSTIGEGSLEWIQVHPDYRGRGLGKTIVNHLVGQLMPACRFVSVAGEVENETSPDALYRACGFTGQDIWWVLS
jgi:ribosomal protein S18 acetylase RimI-like enzyme